MSARTTPPFRADHVGSFLRPKFLLDAREQFVFLQLHGLVFGEFFFGRFEFGTAANLYADNIQFQGTVSSYTGATQGATITTTGFGVDGTNTYLPLTSVTSLRTLVGLHRSYVNNFSTEDNGFMVTCDCIGSVSATNKIYRGIGGTARGAIDRVRVTSVSTVFSTAARLQVAYR